MTIELTPDVGVPITPEIKIVDLHERAQAAAATADLLEDHGLEITPNAEDKDIAAGLSNAYAANPSLTSKTVNHTRASKLTPASMQLTRNILDEFSHAIVNNATEIRRLVTNKLILESDNPDPRVRIRALELLGKITDVGLFTEKSEVTIIHQSTEELRKSLREKFKKIMQPDTDIESPNEITIEGEIIDVDAELGLKTTEKTTAKPTKPIQNTEETPIQPVETPPEMPERTERGLEPTIEYDDMLEAWQE